LLDHLIEKEKAKHENSRGFEKSITAELVARNIAMHKEQERIIREIKLWWKI